MRVRLPDGAEVLAQGRLDLVPSERPRAPDYAVYLDARWRDDGEVAWPSCVVDWEDFGLPADEPGFFALLVDLHRRARDNELVEIACYGGLGRTGTALACLAVLGGLSAGGAVIWVRREYHPSAIETADQEQLVARFEATRRDR